MSKYLPALRSLVGQELVELRSLVELFAERKATEGAAESAAQCAFIGVCAILLRHLYVPA